MVAVEEEETDELRRFRESWKRELQEKKKLQQSLQDSAPPAAALPEQLSSTSETNPLHHSGVFRPRNDALEVYSRAVKHEQAGELDDALRLYRQAFRTDSNVDRLYHLREQRTTRTLEALALTATTAEENVENKAAVLVNAQSNSVVPKPPSSAPHPEQQVSGLLADILAGFPIPLSFEPEDERVSLVLQRLPDELLVYILSYLGAAAIERFALVSRKARVITLDATIWRLLLLPFSLMRSAVHYEHCLFRTAFSARCHGGRRSSHSVSLHRSFVETIYRPPQISPNETLDDILDKHSSDYRRVYVERPRVRLDGVYIAVCHYMYLPVKEVHLSCHS
jgi:F-box protein 9